MSIFWEKCSDKPTIRRIFGVIEEVNTIGVEENFESDSVISEDSEKEEQSEK